MPTVEVLFDPLMGALLSGALPFDPEQHELLYPGDWISSLRRRLDMDELFVYRHRLHNSFVVAGWAIPPTERCGSGGAMVELELMSAPPDWDPPDRPDMAYMVLRTAPVREQGKRAIRNIREKAAAERALRQSTAEEKDDRVRHLLRHGQEPEAALLRTGQAPFMGEVEGGETMKQMKKDLYDMAKRTI